MSDLGDALWVTVRVDVPVDDADLVAGLLWSAGVAGIEERIPAADPDHAVELLAGADHRVLDEVRAVVAGRWPFEVEVVHEDAWLDEWRRWARPWRAGSRVVVLPAWLARPDWVGVDDVVVELDPGRAFGSGAHATTRLCLAELEARVQPGDSVLDVGCGSGVLSIAAAQLGARRVEAIDIDQEAVRATCANAGRNGVGGVVEASLTPLDEVAGGFPLVVANIAASTLVALGPDLLAHTTPGGSIVLSGVLAGQAEGVTEAMTGAGARSAGTAADGDWRALVFQSQG